MFSAEDQSFDGPEPDSGSLDQCTAFTRITQLLDLLWVTDEALSSENIVLLNAGAQRLAIQSLPVRFAKLGGSANGRRHRNY